MRHFEQAVIPVVAILTTCVAMIAPVVAGGGVADTPPPPSCDGYCSSQTLICTGSNMRCCCKVSGVWTCQCKLPTDCNTGNGCQDGGTT